MNAYYADHDSLEVTTLVSQLLRDGQPGIYRKVGSAVDKAILRAALRYTKGNQVQASELLGISRTTLRAKLRSLGLVIEKQLSSETR
jgi:two-component system nitrogen regulation response regulator GlnG